MSLFSKNLQFYRGVYTHTMCIFETACYIEAEMSQQLFSFFTRFFSPVCFALLYALSLRQNSENEGEKKNKKNKRKIFKGARSNFKEGSSLSVT